MNFNVMLFDNFETIDALGPVEVIGKIPNIYKIQFYSENGGVITSCQNVRIETLPLTEIEPEGILLIPGGMGTRKEIDNSGLVDMIGKICEDSKYVMTVCTGSALLAKTGLLKGKEATTNKIAFDWVVEQDPEVLWKRKARWVNDGKYYTSSGVSAGIDMALGFIADVNGRQYAEKIAHGIEYIWNDDKNNDPFSI